MDRKNELIQIIGNNKKYKDDNSFNLEWRKKINTLVSAWEMGLTDRQAAAECGVSMTTLRYYFEAYPELNELKEICGEKIRIDAKKNVRDAIKRGHLETSKWYLEKTDPDFQKNSDTTVNVAVISVADREKEMNKFMERFTDAGVIESVESEK